MRRMGGEFSNPMASSPWPNRMPCLVFRKISSISEIPQCLKNSGFCPARFTLRCSRRDFAKYSHATFEFVSRSRNSCAAIFKSRVPALYVESQVFQKPHSVFCKSRAPNVREGVAPSLIKVFQNVSKKSGPDCGGSPGLSIEWSGFFRSM